MATYKAVIIPPLEYVFFIWSPLASSTSITKLQVMQNAALRTATGCTKTQTYNTCMTKHSYFPYMSTYSSTRHNTNRKHNIHHTPYTNIQHTSKAKTLSSTTAITQQTSHRRPHIHYNRHKNKHAPYTYIYCL